MGLSSEMKNLSEDILASFKQRIKENEELVIEVQKTLDGFQKDHQDMAAALRASLAKGEKNRLKEADIFMKKTVKDHKDMAAALRSDLATDEKKRLKEFVALMKNINEEISEIFTYTHSLLARFDKEHQDMAVALRAGLDKDEINRLKEFVALMKNINEEVLRIFSYTHDLLARFDKEHMEMSVELRKNLSDGEVERIKEFNVVMTGIRIDVKSLKNAVAELMGDFAQDREGASAAWKKMSDILAQLRKTAVTPPKQVVKKEVKKEAPVTTKVEAPVEAVMEIPVAAKVEAVPEVSLTLEQKVLNFINKHPKGVKISEMEEPLVETRMKLGFIAKSLLDEGKVQKVDNVYYPLK